MAALILARSLEFEDTSPHPQIPDMHQMETNIGQIRQGWRSFFSLVVFLEHSHASSPISRQSIVLLCL